MPSVLCILDMLDEAQPNACGYIRLFLPLTKRIVREHFDIRFVKFEDLPYFTADVVVTQRTVVKTPAMADRLLAYCRDMGARFVFDLDDDLLALPRVHPEHRLYDGFKPVGLQLAAEADEFWTSTPSLADRFAGIAHSISVVPNELDDRIWSAPRSDVPVSRAPVRFLYMGTPTHRPDFDELIRPAWSQLKAEFGDKIELDLIGVTNETGPGGEWTVVHRSAEIGNSYPAFVTWLQSLGSYDIGLAPLMDVAFNRCKSDVKWLEYSGMGLATIAADLPAYSQSIEHERTGLLAPSDANGFRAAMRRLIVEPGLRRSLRQNAARLAGNKLLAAPTEEPRLERLLDLVRAPRRDGFRSVAARQIATAEVLRGRIDRQTLSQAFLRGRGIEIGALHNPLPVPPGTEVRYVDRMSKADLYEHYPELREHDLVAVDVIDNGETLSTFPDCSQDFIIINHFIEHCQDPIGTLKNLLRVLRSGGTIYMAVPDMRRTFDRNRLRTEISHMVTDHSGGPAVSRQQHFREWATLVEPHFGRVYTGEEVIEQRVRELMTQDYSIHFHTFIPEDISALIRHCAQIEGMPLSVVFAGEFGEEMIFILRKGEVPDEPVAVQESSPPSYAY
jgi:predicted SAM-dependent methyltransferase/glycosyltransferase involved in cell wall biosynthesis